LVKDQDILQYARHYAIEVLKNDPNLDNPEYTITKKVLHDLTNKKTIWNYIS